MGAITRSIARTWGTHATPQPQRRRSGLWSAQTSSAGPPEPKEQSANWPTHAPPAQPAGPSWTSPREERSARAIPRIHPRGTTRARRPRSSAAALPARGDGAARAGAPHRRRGASKALPRKGTQDDTRAAGRGGLALDNAASRGALLRGSAECRRLAKLAGPDRGAPTRPAAPLSELGAGRGRRMDAHLLRRCATTTDDNKSSYFEKPSQQAMWTAFLPACLTPARCCSPRLGCSGPARTMECGSSTDAARSARPRAP